MTGPSRSSSKPSDRAPIDPPTTTLSPKPYKSSKLPPTSQPRADGHYLNEADRKAAHLPILRSSSKQVAVANGHISAATHVSRLPFPGLSKTATKADTFHDFPQSLMSVGKVSDDGTLSIFTKDGVTVHKEEDVLITCKGAPLLIGVRDDQGRYRIPLTQHKGTWQPRQPSKRAKQALQQANSVYDLPSTEQAIKWMHAVCGYPVKSTWLKAIKAGNFVGWPLLTEANVKKYYPRPQKPLRAPQPNAEERTLNQGQVFRRKPLQPITWQESEGRLCQCL
eukprot:CCRYP_014585-RA/>CCRYP_014585-RA protein AED:0.40 eAED:0.48 QI:0/0/0/1/1/1/2/0/278